MWNALRKGVPFAVVSMLLACAQPLNTSVYDGGYVWGPEVEIFSSCATGKQWWVRTSDDVRRQLRAEHDRVAVAPYEGIYARVSGAYDGPVREELDGAFARQYEGAFK